MGLALVGLSVATGAATPDAEKPIHELAERLVLYDGKGGASCSHFLANVLPWQKRGGDWIDAQGQVGGSAAVAVATPGATSTSWDVTAYARAKASARKQYLAFFMRPVSGEGYAVFRSREAAQVADWPILALQYSDGSRKLLKPEADMTIDCSTFTSQGHLDKLLVSAKHNALLQFKLPAPAPAATLARAQLILFGAGAGGSAVVIGAFEPLFPSFPAAPVLPGLASRYEQDRGIERDTNVLFAAGFEKSGSLRTGWSRDSSGEMDLVTEDRAHKFVALSGAALRVTVKRGSNLGADLRLNLRDLGTEPEEIYFRYYLRLGEDWNPQIADGKMPGLAGTYGKSGWGGRAADGSDGWSLRGSFMRGYEPDHPFHGLTQMGTYAYHADMQGTYGDFWQWPGALLQRNRWYCIEQHLRLNKPGVNDGLLRVWVDGRQVIEKAKIRLRNTPDLRIETVWFNVYHGGTEVSPQDQHLYIDNVVVARSYIGPLGGSPSVPAPSK